MQIRKLALLGVAVVASAQQGGWQGVPSAYRGFPYGELKIASTRSAWETQRQEIRDVLHRCLGETPPRPQPLQVRTISREKRKSYIVEKVSIDNGVDAFIPAYVAIPNAALTPAPAILVLHWHDGSKDGVLFGGEEQTVGEALLDRGYVVMAIDGYFNGERLGSGPAGDSESLPRLQRDTFFKLHMWLGRSLWGMMLRDYRIALDYLVARPEVDRSQIGVTGMSMGSTGAWWLAALDDRVKAVAATSAITRYRELVAGRGLSHFGLQYFVPGILRHFDTEAVMGLIAPRPFLAQTGDRDAASPPEGVRLLEEKVHKIYGLYDATDRFRVRVFEGAGHTYLPEMKYHMVNWFDRWLH